MTCLLVGCQFADVKTCLLVGCQDGQFIGGLSGWSVYWWVVGLVSLLVDCKDGQFTGGLSGWSVNWLLSMTPIFIGGLSSW